MNLKIFSTYSLKRIKIKLCSFPKFSRYVCILSPCTVTLPTSKVVLINDRQTDYRTDGWTDGLPDGQIDRRTSRRTDRQTDFPTDRSTDGLPDGQINRRTSRRTDGQTDFPTGVWTNRKIDIAYDKENENNNFISEINDVSRSNINF